MERRARQGDALGEPQRLLLRAGSHERQVPAGEAVREGELGQRARRQQAGQSRRRQPSVAHVPGNQGATNWYSPSFSPRTGLFYVSTWEDYATIYGAGCRCSIRRAEHFDAARTAGRMRRCQGRRRRRRSGADPINNWTEAAGNGAVIALDPARRAEKWKYDMTDVADRRDCDDCVGCAVHGQSRRLFPGARRAHRELALEDEPRGQIVSGPITYMVDGKQYVSMVAGHVARDVRSCGTSQDNHLSRRSRKPLQLARRGVGEDSLARASILLHTM